MEPEQIDNMVEAFDRVRAQFAPTNGETIAVFTVLIADTLAEAGDLADDLYPPVERVLKTRGLDGDAMKALFERCALKFPKRRR